MGLRPNVTILTTGTENSKSLQSVVFLHLARREFYNFNLHFFQYRTPVVLGLVICVRPLYSLYKGGPSRKTGKMFEKTLQDVVKGIRANKRDPSDFISATIAEIKVELKSSDAFVKAQAVSARRGA